jgi:hypothetical protein
MRRNGPRRYVIGVGFSRNTHTCRKDTNILICLYTCLLLGTVPKTLTPIKFSQGNLHGSAYSLIIRQ